MFFHQGTAQNDDLRHRFPERGPWIFKPKATLAMSKKILPHYVENTGDTDLKFIEMFKSSYFQDLSLNEWLTHEPPDLVMAHLNLDKATLDAIPQENHANLPAS